MAADTTTYVSPRLRLHEHFALRATCDDPPRWRAQAWARAVFVLPRAADDEIVALLDREWAAFRAEHPGEPAITFQPPPPVPDEPVVPGPPPYDQLPPLRFGRYGVDLPSHEERVRDEQERLARRDHAFYGF